MVPTLCEPDRPHTTSMLVDTFIQPSLELEEPVKPVKVISKTLPEGISIGNGPYGRCLIATKCFTQGESVYRGSVDLVPSSADQAYVLRVLDASTGTTQEFDMTVLNSVLVGDVRQQYSWDGFMNHSCDPNLYCPEICHTDATVEYDALAMRDIQIGDEITCDYALFDWECNGHEIECCGCGSQNCRGEMRGFKHLTLDQKIRVMHMVDPELMTRLLKEEAETLELLEIDATVPETIRIEQNTADDWHMIATTQFSDGDLIFKNTMTEIPESNKQYIAKLAGTYRLMKPWVHFIHRENFREWLWFDTFMDHSCAPNTRQEYHNQFEYSVYAVGEIEIGDKITCDYEKLDNDSTGEVQVVSEEFNCYCGSDQCRGNIAI